MNIYLAGPMRGLPDYNFPAFRRAADALRLLGHTVFNPAERDIEKYGEDTVKSDPAGWDYGSKKIRSALLADVTWICKKADAIAVLPGWKNSRGATAEHAVAVALGLEVIFLD